MIRTILLSAAVVVVLAGCTKGPGTDKQPRHAQLLNSPQAKPQQLVTPAFREIAQELAKGHGLPPLPPSELPPIEMPTSQPSDEPLPAWATAKLDASSFDALQRSLDRILAEMPIEVAEVYDYSVKYLLIQVTADPAVIRAASSGGTPSDEQLMEAVRRILHGKSPEQIIEEALALERRLATEGP